MTIAGVEGTINDPLKPDFIGVNINNRSTKMQDSWKSQ
jgi:hypothetical protein